MNRSRLLWFGYKSLMARWMLAHVYSQEQRQVLCRNGDPIRYGTVSLALDQIAEEKISGALAECGVHRGALSRFLHARLPEKKLYLFDTFRGFDPRDSDTLGDSRFTDTSEEEVMRHIGDSTNVVARKGYFPDTAAGLEAERFAFVMIDFDKYEPTLAALRFFYPRMEKGGVVFVHDYNSPESNWACKRALDGFLQDKPEQCIAIPDTCGSAVFRKV